MTMVKTMTKRCRLRILPTALKAILGLDNLDSSGGLPVDEANESIKSEVN